LNIFTPPKVVATYGEYVVLLKILKMQDFRMMLQYKIALTLIPGIGDITGKKLVAYCGGVEEVFSYNRKNFLAKKVFGEAVIHKVLAGRDEALRRSEKEIAFIEKYKIATLFFLDKEYPYRMTNCIDAPIMLYYKGNADLNHPRIVAVVGTRSATAYGKDMCKKIIEGLAEDGVLVASGLAYGIDSCAHKHSLACDMPTIGVLGHGLDRIYPAANKSLAEKMLKNGGLLTEFVSNTNPDRENFPKRNRIIAGMCDALVVVEAAHTGGALITADIANSYDRDVFAVPGRVGDEYSNGCNKFVKTNRAALVESAADIKYLMGWEAKKTKKPAPQRTLFVELSPEEQTIVDVMKSYGEAGIDVLVTESGLNSSKTASILLNLEFNGMICCLPGKRYRLQ
jgi:DNA processing protein